MKVVCLINKQTDKFFLTTIYLSFKYLLILKPCSQNLEMLLVLLRSLRKQYLFLIVNLTAIGPVANHWMSIAQCFAGSPERPPAKGSRCIH
jgi:hypothetical protein